MVENSGTKRRQAFTQIMIVTYISSAALNRLFTLSFKPLVHKLCMTVVQWTEYLGYFEMYMSGPEPLRQWY